MAYQNRPFSLWFNSACSPTPQPMSGKNVPGTFKLGDGPNYPVLTFLLQDLPSHLGETQKQLICRALPEQFEGKLKITHNFNLTQSEYDLLKVDSNTNQIITPLPEGSQQDNQDRFVELLGYESNEINAPHCVMQKSLVGDLTSYTLDLAKCFPNPKTVFGGVVEVHLTVGWKWVADLYNALGSACGSAADADPGEFAFRFYLGGAEPDSSQIDSALTDGLKATDLNEFKNWVPFKKINLIAMAKIIKEMEGDMAFDPSHQNRPLFGSPCGVGMFQLDNLPGTEAGESGPIPFSAVWDYKEQCRLVFEVIKAKARASKKRLGSGCTAAEVAMDIFTRYNSGASVSLYNGEYIFDTSSPVLSQHPLGRGPRELSKLAGVGGISV